MIFLQTIKGEKKPIPPLWMMRQAGRYLPGYRSMRAHHKDFLSLCLTPQSAVEVTLEPIRYFDLDAAILFSDILVVPLAFGQEVRFEEGRGPVLGSLPVGVPSFNLQNLSAVFEAVQEIRHALSPDKALIGFAGSPWTVLSYMVEGGSSKSFETLKAFVYGSSLFERWMTALIEATTVYLLAQIQAGANVVMLFDSWAGQIPYDLRESCCIEPHQQIVRNLRSRAPAVPIIIFPRHLPLESLCIFSEKVAPDVIGVSNLYGPESYAHQLPSNVVVQLGPDPVLLKLGGEKLKMHVRHIQTTFKDRPYIMNLSHGVLPQTPIENVHQFIQWVRQP